VIASSLAGSLTAIVINPFDVVTRRVQTGEFKNSRSAVVSLVRSEGVVSLFRGLSPTLMMFASTNALYFPSYVRLRSYLETQGFFSPSICPLIAGTTARAAVAVLSSPMEFLRTNMQANAATKKNTAGKVMRTIVASGGKTLWSGLVPTLWRDVPYSALYWMMVEHIRLTYGGADRSQYTFGLHFAAGSMSGLFASLITHPVDVCKTQMQMKISTRETLVDIMKRIVRTNGVLGLYRGLFPRVAKLVPASAVMLSTFELVRAL
jgi:solute carrier family 25 protein 39/40